MATQADAYFQALLSRDYRFDGKFFVAVKTTGVYCRPICPARPKPENVEFFTTALLAEKAGYRPCLRCRPECAPGSPAWSGKNTTIDLALKLIAQNAHEGLHEEAFARRLGMGARHLRRLFKDELGKTPKQIYHNNRLNFARTLVVETQLSMTDIALASGFSSLRRFNDAMKLRFHRPPGQLRRSAPSSSQKETSTRLSLAYRPPLDWPHVLSYYQRHPLPGIQHVTGDVFERVFSIGKEVGAFRVWPHPHKPELILETYLRDPKDLFRVAQGVRRMFDLDSDPVLIANAFQASKVLSSLIIKRPGLRLPRGWDPFEVTICTILGQLVSVERAAALIKDLIDSYGEKIVHPITGEAVRLFPRPEALARASLKEVKTTTVRKQTIRDLSRQVACGELNLASTQDPAAFRKKLLTIKGIGPWSVEYISLRALGDTDAFPSEDLFLKRAITQHKTLNLDSVKPWRAYAAFHLLGAHAPGPRPTPG